MTRKIPPASARRRCDRRRDRRGPDRCRRHRLRRATGRAGELRAGEHCRADDQRHAAGRPDADREPRHVDERHDADVRVPVAPLRLRGQQLRRDHRRDRADLHRAAADVDKTPPRHRDGDESDRLRSATSAQTAVVTAARPAAGAIKMSNGQTSVPASSIDLPERLIVDGVRFTPTASRAARRSPGRFHVSDTRGYVVRDALVKVTAPAVLVGPAAAPRSHRPGRLGDRDDHADASTCRSASARRS